MANLMNPIRRQLSIVPMVRTKVERDASLAGAERWVRALGSPATSYETAVGA
jgi:hypothetical protein